MFTAVPPAAPAVLMMQCRTVAACLAAKAANLAFDAAKPVLIRPTEPSAHPAASSPPAHVTAATSAGMP